MATKKKNPRTVGPIRWFAAVLGSLLIGGIGATVLEAGCISAELPAPMRLPGGEGFAHGRLSLCNVRTLSPVSSLYRFEVDGAPIGMLVTRRGTNEATGGQRPVMVFNRDAEGGLTLAGFATPEGSRMATHFVSPSPPRKRGGTEIARSAPRAAETEAPLLLVRAQRGADTD